jgi:hypothetical protein
MPTLLPDDVLKTAKTILVHWPQVSAALTKPLILQGNYSLADFTTDLNALDTLLQAMPGVENAYGLALNERDALKAPLKTRLKQFRAAVQSELTDSSYAKELPTQPVKTLGEAAFLTPFDDMGDLWKRINTDTIPGFTPPLTLAGEYNSADFALELNTLRGTYQKTRTVIDAAEQARARRNAQVKTLWERIKQYRKGCIAKLPPNNTLLKNIP